MVAFSIKQWFVSPLSVKMTDRTNETISLSTTLMERAVVHDGDDPMAHKQEQVPSECMLVLKGHRLCIVCVMAFKGLMLHKHSAFSSKKSWNTPTPTDERPDETKWALQTKNTDWGTAREKRTSPAGSPQRMSGDGTHTHTSFYQHGKRLWINLVLYGATVCIHVHIEIDVRSHTVSSQSRMDSVTDNRSCGLMGRRSRIGQVGLNSGENGEFCVVASHTHSDYIYIHIHM